ncbi:uncharacterized protein [Leptinotarsa decemlineata]|uniref:uncharacterized protein n=1 Tax=Leptinotarsa decemlineata TaxID=7539 RepID=UPI003D30C225
MSFCSEASNDFSRDLNTKHLIEEIRLRPAIWDTSCDDYTDKRRRRECWEELTYLFLAKSDVSTPVSEAEREIFTKLLQRRWKNVRDCFTRELLRYKKIKSGRNVPRKSTYLYFKQLFFLKDVVKPDNRREKIKSSVAETRAVKNEPQCTSIPNENFCRNTTFESHNDPLASSTVPEIHSEEDCDRMFLLSLLNPLKKIPEDKRFDVKMEIMQVIQNAQLSFRNGGTQIGEETSSVLNIEEELSLDSIKEPLTPTLSDNSNNSDIV